MHKNAFASANTGINCTDSVQNSHLIMFRKFSVSIHVRKSTLEIAGIHWFKQMQLLLIERLRMKWPLS